MAEYTIPKPYRDFYVTNPYIELKESNERLQKVVSTGYVATDAFDLAGNQVITFDKEKHGFSLTNDYGKMSSESISFSDSYNWDQGGFNLDTGAEESYAHRIRTYDYFPIYGGVSYTITCTDTASNSLEVLLFYYDSEKTFVSVSSTTFNTTNTTLQIPTNISFVKVMLRKSDNSDITPRDIFANTPTIKLTMVVPSSPSLTVAENVVGIPTTADGWEQGFYSITTGLPSYTVQFIRTSSFIPVKSNVEYTLNASFSTNTYYVIVSHYDENKQHIETTALTSFPVKFKTSNKTKYIHISLYMDSYTEITPTSVISELTYMRMTSDPMIVTENDTRIVTMPPFTSLYIESNVLYHGHALDLSE